MLRVLPLNERKNPDPGFVLCIEIGYGEHCNDTYTTNSARIDDAKASPETGFVSEKDACNIVKIIERALKVIDSGHILLNDGIDPWWCGGMEYEDFFALKDFYGKYEFLFDPRLEHEWYGVTDAYIRYIDEDWQRHKVEIV